MDDAVEKLEKLGIVSRVRLPKSLIEHGDESLMVYNDDQPRMVHHFLNLPGSDNHEANKRNNKMIETVHDCYLTIVKTKKQGHEEGLKSSRFFFLKEIM